MPKKVYANVAHQKIMDGANEVEDVTKVGLPDVAFTTTEFNTSGLAGVLELANPSHVEKMNYSIAHNNGTNCHLLETPGTHEQEFRLARQYLDTAKADMQYDSVKIRVKGQPIKVSHGDVELGNPLGSTVEYACQRFEKEVNGEIVTLIDVAAGMVTVNGVDYMEPIRSIID